MSVALETEERDGAVRVALTGDLDFSTAADVEKQLTELEERARPSWLVLDLRGLRFIDSTGLSLVINADHRGRKVERRVTIVSGTGAARRILDATGLRGRLDVVEEAPDLGLT